MAQEKKRCPICGVEVKISNYESHLYRVHKKTIEEAEGKDEKHEKSIGRNMRGRRRKTVALIFVVMLISSIFAYYLFFLNTPDRDNDGIPDSWEKKYGFNPEDKSDALGDPDGDGLSNLGEYEAGTDPFKADTDGDGMPDGWEVSYSLDPLGAYDATRDYDADGLTNLEEYEMKENPIQDVFGIIDVQDYGVIKIKLAPRAAPETVRNFVKYAEDQFYNGLIFHRVIEGFMIQGGGFYPNMTQKQTTYPPIVNEASKAQLRNLRGTIAMARTDDPNSATSQFYINQVDNPGLDWDQAQDGYGYCVFGEVIDGIDVVDAIASVPTGEKNGHQNVPLQPVIISSITITWAE